MTRCLSGIFSFPAFKNPQKALLGLLFFSAIGFCPTEGYAQWQFGRAHDIPVVEDGDTLLFPWAGGLNNAQISRLDVNRDGVRDLFVFDRTGNRILTFISVPGGQGPNAYRYTSAYNNAFPELQDWVKLRDYDGDGKKDIFASTNAGIEVYRNNSAQGKLSFSLVTELLESDYQPADSTNSKTNIFVSSTDIPAIDDIDRDGDLDVLTFSLTNSSIVEYHKNLSVERYGHNDSLDYQLRNKCWGFFREGQTTNDVTLRDSCSYNVPDPELIQNKKPVREEHRSRHSLHSGSTLLTFDMNGDGVRDLLLGDLGFNNMVGLTNGGEPESSLMTEKDTLFPSTTTPVDIEIFPAAFYADVDRDGTKDLIAAPNKTGAQNIESTWFYKNEGSNSDPDLSLENRSLLQDEMIDVGAGAMPVLHDYNGNGRQDLFVGNWNAHGTDGKTDGRIAFYENVGTVNAPRFELVDADLGNFSASGMGEALYPAFGDLDGDGDADMLIGASNGKLHYYRNMADQKDSIDPVLQKPNYPDQNGAPIDVGEFAKPQLVDLDRDGTLDLVIGEKDGNVNYYENVGSPSSPEFKLRDDSLGDVDVTTPPFIEGHSVPVIFEDSGSYKLLSGSTGGYLRLYDNIEGNLNGTFNAVDTTFAGYSDGSHTAPALGDLNGDGKWDMLIGNSTGGLAWLKRGHETEIELHGNDGDLSVW